MKKIIHHTILVILLLYISGCSGYKPIFSSSGIKINIMNYSIEGEKKIGKKIYSKLYNSSQYKKEDVGVKNVNLLINVSKNKEATVKSSTGKILNYKITLNIKVSIGDIYTNKQLLERNIIYSDSYKVQDQHSETIRLENKLIDNLTNKIFQDILIELTATLATQ